MVRLGSLAGETVDEDNKVDASMAAMLFDKLELWAQPRKCVKSDRPLFNQEGNPLMARYESDITQFMRELMDKNPELRVLQKQNRATWWDRNIDLEEQRRNEQSEAPKQPYAYFPLPAPIVKI